MTKYGMTALRWTLTICLAAGSVALTAHAQSNGRDAHLTIDNPADLTKEEAQLIYEDLMDRLEKGYASSRLKIISNYQSWPAYNDAPYVSATHGQRYVNNYANKRAHNYATLKDGEVLPVGSVLAKDSVTITQDDQIFPAALFVMEKLPEGQSPDTADWRYIMVMPDGSLFGDTMGSRSDAITHCHECHESVASRDYTFFVPEEYRVKE